MIGKLKGNIDSIFDNKLILDVNGIGYNIYSSSKNLNFLQEKKGQEISIFIETIVREDYIHLYGFLSEIEKTWFNELCKVNGVGNRVALKILNDLSIDDIILALNSGDKTLFSKVSGIGPKLALRIISELKDSTKKISGDFIVNSSNKTNDVDNNNKTILTDAISALENLGYKRAGIYPTITQQIVKNPNITLETLITNSLRLISKNNH